MATHQVQLSLRRAARTSRSAAPLTTYATALAGLAGAAAAAVTGSMHLLGSSWRLALIAGLASALAAAALAAAFAARLSASLADLAKAAGLAADGDFRFHLPAGPGLDIARLSAAFDHMAATLSDDLNRLRDHSLSLEERLRPAGARHLALARGRPHSAQAESNVCRTDRQVSTDRTSSRPNGGLRMGQAALRVLIVDDDPDHALLMRRALSEELKAEASVCASAATALDALRAEPPDAVVLDYHLPDADGWDALAAIRERADLPVVVVTCQGSEAVAVEALKAGAEDYLPKDGDYLRALPAAVFHAIEAHRRRRDEAAQLKQTSDALARSLELDSVAAASLDAVIALLDPDAAWLLLPDREGALELVASRGVSPDLAEQGEAIFRSRATAPIVLDERLRPGFLCAGAKAPGRFRAHHLELLGAIAAHTASAARNARLFASLARAKAQWERTFDSISDPILITNPDFRLVRINRAAADCFDLPLKEAVGRICHELISDADHPCPWHEALSRGLPVSSDRFLPKLNRWFSFSAFPFEDGDGRRDGVVHVLRDITEERNLRRQMAQAQKLAALGELVAGVAHELNNPLTGILGFAHLVLRKDLDESLRPDLEKIAGEARRAARIVRNLSAFSRDPSCSRLSRRPADINRLLEQTLELRSYYLNVSGIDVVLELDRSLPQTAADPEELQQVFLNIINNAEHAMAEGRPRQSLFISSTLASSGRIRLQFRDTGPGIPEKILDRIFDPFFTTKDASRGTGLGLSVCYGIVRAHGGSITAANHFDGGAVFTIELPVVEAPPADAPDERPEPADLDRASCRVLVVDDEPVVAAYLERLLVEEGHRVTVSGDGSEAIALLRNVEFDLVICDLKLPDTGGPEVYDEAVSARPYLRARFLFLTGDTLGPDTTDFLRRWRGPWLEKPVLPDDLKEAVNRLLAQEVAHHD